MIKTPKRPSIVSYLYPKTIETRHSEFNHELKVVAFMGKYSVQAGNLTQSGGLVTEIWKKTTEYLNNGHFATPPQKLLLLGLGAGSAVEPITKVWPKVKLTGVEIDPLMIELGADYFHLKNYPNLEVVNQNAFYWLKRCKAQFDVIYIDLYNGRVMPEPATRKEFFEEVNNHLTKNGIAVFNRLVLKGQQSQAQTFEANLRDTYQTVIRIPTPTNWLLACK
jgi:spermidine synthase